MKKIFLFRIYKLTRETLPLNDRGALVSMLIVSFIRSLLDFFGLLMIIPIFDLLVSPEIIQHNRWLNQLYNAVNFSSAAQFTLFIMCGVLIAFAFKVILSYWCINYQSKKSFKIVEDISLMRFSSYLKEPMTFFSNQNSAILARNFANLPFEFGQKILIPYISLINELLVVCLVCGGMLWYNALLFTTVIAVILPFMYLYFRSLRKELHKLSAQRDTDGQVLFKISQQSMNAYREINLFQKANYFKKIFFNSMSGVAGTIRKQNTMNEMSPKITELTAVLGVFIIFLVAFIVKQSNKELLEFLVAFIIATSRLLPSTNRILLFINQIKSADYVFEYLKISYEPVKTEQQTPNKPEGAPLLFNDTLQLKNISFKHENASEPIFNNLNLSIKKGETIGIVGPSGSGKTTLLNILLRLHIETSGGVYVDDKKITGDNLSQWYDLISYVPQNIFILDGTFLENIAFGVPLNEIDRKRIEEVAKRAELWDLITHSHEGLNTHIGEGGLKISGGQRQRIGIARALYTGASVLIFDEATSALDGQTEEMITESIRRLSHNDLTIIIVAHRLQTLRYCGAIYKLENGILSEGMAYEKLINR